MAFQARETTAFSKPSRVAIAQGGLRRLVAARHTTNKRPPTPEQQTHISLLTYTFATYYNFHHFHSRPGTSSAKRIKYYKMSHCHDEHSGHGHDHDHEHDHSDDITPAVQFSLYEQVNFDEITTLNEATRDAGKAVVKKTWAERLSVEPELNSDADEQLLMTVPYVHLLPRSMRLD